jgi:DnaJ like chaperone protein
LLGLVVGHRFDQGYARRWPRSGLASPPVEEAFFATAFGVMGHIAKMSGRVAEEDIRAARRVMHGMRLTPEQTRAAIDYFTLGKAPDYPILERLTELAARIERRRDVARAFLEIQVQAAAGGSFGAAKRELLWRIAQRLGVGRAELAQIEALVRARAQRSGDASRQVTLDEAYRVLGLTAAANDQEIKTAYRRLMNQHHPDKLVARGLPKSMAPVAQEKTLEIRSAYERIKAYRQLK